MLDEVKTMGSAAVPSAASLAALVEVRYECASAITLGVPNDDELLALRHEIGPAQIEDTPALVAQMERSQEASQAPQMFMASS